MINQKLKFLIVLDPENDAWIISKIVKRLREHLEKSGHEAQIKHAYSDGFDVVFWSHYRNLPLDHMPVSQSREYFFVTHVDDSKKLRLCKSHIEKGIKPICMSTETAREISRLLGLSNLPSVMKIGSDIAPARIRKVRIVMSSSIYPDGRKNESWIAEIHSESILSKSEFIFFGSGWESVVEQIRNSGGTAVSVDNSVIDQNVYAHSLAQLRDSDLFIYTGFDEGSLGVLDAYLLNLDLLVSNQGFHVELRLNPEQLFDSKHEFYEKLETRVEQIWQRNVNQTSYSWSEMSNQFISIVTGESIKVSPSLTSTSRSICRSSMFELRKTRAKRVAVHIWYILKSRIFR